MKVTVKGALEFQIEEQAPRLVFDITYKNLQFKNVSMLILPNDQKVLAHVTPVDAKGNPAKIDGVPNWTSSNEAVATVTPNPDDGSGTFSAWVTPASTLGTCQVNVTADADLGSGTTTITGLLDVQTVGGTAVGFQIQTDAPVPQ